MKFGALLRSKAANPKHLKTLDPNVLRFIPLPSRNSTRFNTFILGRVRYSSPEFLEHPQRSADFEREGKLRNASMRSFLFSMHDISLAPVGDNTKNFRYPWLSDQKLVMEAASCASLTGSRSRRHKGPFNDFARSSGQPDPIMLDPAASDRVSDVRAIDA
jgi:hypothetical protein